jgi:hypothetical protein
VTAYEKKLDIVDAVAWDPQDQQPMIDFLTEKNISYNIVGTSLTVHSGFMNISIVEGQFVVVTRESVCFPVSAVDMADLYTEIV